MTAKDMYRKACWLAHEIELHHCMLQNLLDITDPKTRVEGFSRGFKGNRKSDPVGKHVLTFENELEAQRETRRILTELNTEQKIISTAVQEVKRHDYRVILFGRYVQLKQWNDIITASGYKKSRVMELHKEAFNCLLEILQKMGQ